MYWNKDTAMNWMFYSITLVGVVTLKLFYQSAEVEDLHWILEPTATLVGVITGTTFGYVPGIGYVGWQDNVVINASCSGINFMVIAASLAAVTMVSSVTGSMRKCIHFISAVLVSGVVTVFANTMRIVGAIATKKVLSVIPEWPEPEWLHQAEGAFIYISVLVLYYIIIKSIYGKESEIPESWDREPLMDLS